MSPTMRRRLYKVKNNLNQVLRNIEIRRQRDTFRLNVRDASILLLRSRQPDSLYENTNNGTFSAGWRLDANREFWIDSNFVEDSTFFSVRLPDRSLEASIHVPTTEHIVSALSAHGDVTKKLVSLLD